MRYEEIKDKLSHVWPMDPSEARDVLEAGSWANGEDVADNEREALEALAGIEEQEITDDDIRQLGQITTRDDHGRHFTSVYPMEWLERMEQAGLLNIVRPVHQTGIDYDCQYWSVEVTEKGIAMGEACNWGE